jgi:tRNA (cytidine32/uridine32-2'-O)-methyltransferase
MLSNIRIVLVETTHPGNIGATARAMKVMGLSKLYLVKPKKFPHLDAVVRAAGALDILDQAIITESLTDAIADCNLVIGTSARQRTLPIEVLNPRQAAVKASSEINHKVAFVFGQERSGLSNDELLHCHYHLNIPTVKEYSSLNLAASVQIIAYELYQAANSSSEAKIQYDELASANEMALFYEHLQKTLIDIGFLDSENPRHLMDRMRRLFNRARLEKIEANILRGILSSFASSFAKAS